jgi:prepilin peptidase CpaA
MRDSLASLHLVTLSALAMSAVAAVHDLRARRIPSWLTLPALAAAPALRAALAFQEHARGAFGLSGPMLEGMLSVVGALSCAVVPLVLWRGSVMGGGDCKLLASSGALLGPSLGIRVELVALLLAGYFGLARLAFRGQLLSALGRSVAFVFNPVLSKDRRAGLPAGMLDSVPLGPFVLAATVVVLLVPAASHGLSSSVVELLRP